jgi:hypothetical protein
VAYLVASACLFLGLQALLQQEHDALVAIRDAFPALQDVPPEGFYDQNFQYVGASWSIDLLNACERPGYVIHGIKCSEDQHVVGIRFSHFWGELIAPSLPLDLLTYLQNFTFDPDSEFGDAALVLTNSITNQLRHIELEPREYSAGVQPLFLQDQLALLSLAVATDLAMPWADFGNLRWLRVSIGGFRLSDLTTAQFDSLLHLEVVTNILDPQTLSLFGALESLEGPVDVGDSFVWPELPPSLRSIKITGGYGPRIFNLTSQSGTFESLTIHNWVFEEINGLPASTQTVDIQNCNSFHVWHDNAIPPALQMVTLQNMQNVVLPIGLESASALRFLRVSKLHPNALDGPLHLNGTSLQYVELAEVTLTSSVMAEFLCALPAPRMRELHIRAIDQLTSLPECLSEWVNMQELTISSQQNLVPLFWTSLPSSLETFALAGVPLFGSVALPTFLTRFQNLEALVFDGIVFHQEFPADNIMAMPRLRDLAIRSADLSGTLPPNFFDALPTLQELDLVANVMNGTIPSSGWSNLTHVILAQNQFEAWHGLIHTQGKLQFLTVAANHLRTIPLDDDFAGLDLLHYFDVSSNSLLGGPLPAFFKDHPRMTRFLALGCGFEGTIPSPITAPFLRNFDVQMNRLCGTLPDILPHNSSLTSKTWVDLMIYSINDLVGPFPQSWNKLMVTDALWLGDNHLNGTIPSDFIDVNRSTSFTGMSLRNNPDLEGGLPSFITFPSLTLLDMEGTGLDLCASNPTFLSTDQNSCFYPVPASQWCSCAAWWTTCTGSSNPIETCPPESPMFQVPMAPPLGSSSPPPDPPVCVTPSRVRSPEFVAPSSTSPTSPPSSSPSGPSALSCPVPAPQGNFVCNPNTGAWESQTSVEQPEIQIPGGATVVVGGNLTVTTTITFNGLDSQLIVNGCIFIDGSEVVVQMTQEDLELLIKQGKIDLTLITSTGGNTCDGSTDLATVKVVAQKPKGGCRKVKTKNESTRDSLNVLMKIDNTNCNIAIIIPCVVGGIIILAAIATIVAWRRRKARMARYTKT